MGIENIVSFRDRGQGKAVLFAIWHDELFPPLYLHKNEDIVIIVSESRDGEFISRILNSFGYETVRGSSTRGGVKALKNLVRSFKKFPKDVAITIDGPTGPRHIPKQGVIYLAWKLNLPIVPVRSFISLKKVFYKSWDKFQLPLPGARCKVIYGDPYLISHHRLTMDLIMDEIKILKKKMDELKPK